MSGIQADQLKQRHKNATYIDNLRQNFCKMDSVNVIQGLGCRFFGLKSEKSPKRLATRAVVWLYFSRHI